MGLKQNVEGLLTDKQPPVTSETRSANRPSPIMSGMLAVTQPGLFLLSVSSAW